MQHKYRLSQQNVKRHIDKSADSPLCRICEEKGETVHHIVSECKKMAHNVAKRFYWIVEYSTEDIITRSLFVDNVS